MRHLAISFLFIFSILQFSYSQEKVETLPASEADSLVETLSVQGKYAEALPFAEQAVKMRQNSPPDSLYLVSCLNRATLYSIVGEYSKAEQFFIELLKNWERALSKTNEIYPTALSSFADLYNRMGDLTSSEKYYNESRLALIKKYGAKHEKVAKSLQLVGIMYIKMGEFEKAENVFSQSRAIYEASSGKESQEYALATNYLASAYCGMGMFESCLELSLEMVKLFEKVNGKKHNNYLEALNNLALNYWNAKQFDLAEESFTQLLNVIKENGGSPDANILNNLALVYDNLQRFEDAERMFLQALETRGKVNGKQSAPYAESLNNLGTFYLDLGPSYYPKAMKLLEEAFQIRKKIFPKNHPLYTQAISNLAQSYGMTGDFKKAEKYMMEGMQLQKELYGENHPDYYIMSTNLASFYGYTNQLEKAELLSKKNLAQSQLIFPKKHQQIILANIFLARHYGYINLDSTLHYCLMALKVNAENPDFSTDISNENIEKMGKTNYTSVVFAIDALMDMTFVFRGKYKLTQDKEWLIKSYKTYQATFELDDIHRGSFNKEADKLRALDELSRTINKSTKVVYQLSLLGHPEFVETAFSNAERNKSVLLLEELQSKKNIHFGEIPDSLLALEKKLSNDYTKTQKSLADASLPEDQKNSFTKQLNDISLKINQHQDYLKKTYPKYHKFKYESAVTDVQSIQKLLSPQSLLLEYFVGDSSVFIFSVTSDKILLKKVDLPPGTLAEKVGILRKEISDYEYIKKAGTKVSETYMNTAYWFYKTLVEPALIEGKKDLIIVPDNLLGHLPYEVFLTKAANNEKDISYASLPYLLLDYRISYNYSATIWKENRSNPIKNANRKMLAVAASYQSKTESLSTNANRSLSLLNLRAGLIDLPAAKEEVATLSQIYSGDFWQETSSNERHFKENAEGYGIIHLAMHGLLNRKSPILSSLAFTENGDSEEDNFLEAWEISRLKLQAQLVVLSACETGYGKFQQGEGVMSLARAFMYAGVPSLVVSLWQVNDASTAAIMQFFYKNLEKGMDKAEALQQAKLEYIKLAASNNSITAHPAFWAAFVQMGDSRSIKIDTKGGSFWLWVVFGCALLGGGIVLAKRWE